MSQNWCDLCCNSPCICFDEKINELKKDHNRFARFISVMLQKGNNHFVEHLFEKVIANPDLINDFEAQIDLGRGCRIQKSTMLIIKLLSEFEGTVCW